MLLFFLIVILIIATVSDYIFFKRTNIFENRKINIRGILPIGKKQKLLFFAIPLSQFMIMLMLLFFYNHQFIFIVKRMVVIALMWPIAVTDWKELRIPNKILLCGLLLRGIIVVYELIFCFENIVWIVANDVIAAFASLILGLLCSLISRGGMGMGDVKLMFVIALFLGVEGICYSLFMAMVVTFFVSITLLLSRKKDKKDVIPFAPFILVGTFLSFILSGV